jgi:phosphotriesterase-related protein
VSPIVRTVLGEIDPADLGVTYAHEHLAIDRGRPVELSADFLLVDVERMTDEIREAMAVGLRSAVDAMPCDTGRSVTILAALSRATGLHVVASTGLHHGRFYAPGHWSERLSVDELADLFVADLVDGIDRLDYSGPVVHRTGHRAGIVKIAGSDGGPSERDRPIFAAAAVAHARTGAPILTHCEDGTGALEQVRLLGDLGVAPGRVVLSHVDKVVDRGYHREVLATGAFAEYDQSFRWAHGQNGTLRLLSWMAEDGLVDGIVLGMDAARQGYYTAWGGGPGLAWLADGFARQMAGAGLDQDLRRRLFVDNPARALAFEPVRAASPAGSAPAA